MGSIIEVLIYFLGKWSCSHSLEVILLASTNVKIPSRKENRFCHCSEPIFHIVMMTSNFILLTQNFSLNSRCVYPAVCWNTSTGMPSRLLPLHMVMLNHPSRPGPLAFIPILLNGQHYSSSCPGQKDLESFKGVFSSSFFF